MTSDLQQQVEPSADAVSFTPLGKESGRQAPTRGEDESFTISFTSLSIILLSFFIFLNSMATPDFLREREVLGSIAKHFVRGPRSGSEVIPERIARLDMPIPELAIGFPKMSFSTRYGSLADAATAGGWQVERKEDRFVITIPGEKLFASGDDQINPLFLPALTRVAEEMLRHDLALEIEGHTDDRPIYTPRFPSNWELSIARAVSVLRFFLDQELNPNSLSASGRGEQHPVASNETEEGRAKNRRVVLIVKALPKR